MLLLLSCGHNWLNTKMSIALIFLIFLALTVFGFGINGVLLYILHSIKDQGSVKQHIQHVGDNWKTDFLFSNVDLLSSQYKIAS